MADLQFGHADYHRSVAKEARVTTRNRYFEQNPVLTAGNAAMISRMGLRRFLSVGDGPIRATYSQEGSFKDALFVVSDASLYRVETDGVTVTLISGDLNPGRGVVSMAATGTIGATPEYLFVADGRNLWLYLTNGFAHGILSGTPAVGDAVVIGDGNYQFTNGDVNAGASDGSAAHPWLVRWNFDSHTSFVALSGAIGANGAAGTDYTSTASANPDAQVSTINGATITVRSNAIGALGNAIPTTTTGAGLVWARPTLSGGGETSFSQVDTPGDVGAISVGYVSSYVVVIPAQGEGINGRFWWIAPGETTIDPLDFATAERAPDPVFQVVVFGDQFWLPGSTTTEVWYFTGNADTPVLRLQGVTFDRGTWAGTALQIKESMVIVDSDGGVFQISGGLNRISNPAIEEQIRASIQYQAFKGV